MDGTVFDVPYDWKKIKDELRTEGKPILVHIKSLPEPEKSVKWKILERYEKEATQKAVLKEGMKEFLQYLEKQEIKTALVTNNSQDTACLDHAQQSIVAGAQMEAFLLQHRTHRSCQWFERRSGEHF